jgi:hypothetical protein
MAITKGVDDRVVWDVLDIADRLQLNCGDRHFWTDGESTRSGCDAYFDCLGKLSVANIVS